MSNFISAFRPVSVGGVPDGVVSGATLNGGILELSRTQELVDITVDLSPLSGGSSSLQSANGLSVQSGNVVLGGTLTGDTIINQSSFGIGFGFNVSAEGGSSFAQGCLSQSCGLGSHAEGRATTSIGSYSHAEGRQGVTIGIASHTEGFSGCSIGNYSHSEGCQTITNGLASHAEGALTIASGDFSHAEGQNTQATNTASHAEGNFTCALNIGAHAEGSGSRAIGSTSHAEGNNTSACGISSHSEGSLTVAFGNFSHAEGNFTRACGINSHAEGQCTRATGLSSHAEGNCTLASGAYSHAEGYKSNSCGIFAHAEGNCTYAIGVTSHAEGKRTRACGYSSHAEGGSTWAYGVYSHSQGRYTQACGNRSFASGTGFGVDKCIVAYGDTSFNHSCNTISQTIGHGALANNSAILGGRNHNIESGNVRAAIIGGDTIKLTGTTYIDTTAVGNLAIFETPVTNGSNNNALVWNSTTKKLEINTSLGGGSGAITGATNGLNISGDNIALGGTLICNTQINLDVFGLALSPTSSATGPNSIAIGQNTSATGTRVFTQGSNTIARGTHSHAEGYFTETCNLANGAHAEGNCSCAVGCFSHAEGHTNASIAIASHAEGCNTRSCGNASHSEGVLSQSIGNYSHAEGCDTRSCGTASHSEGRCTYAIGDYSHAEGRETCATGGSSHAEGRCSRALGYSSHSEGFRGCAQGNYSHSEGNNTRATGEFSHSEGILSFASGCGSHAQGQSTCAVGDLSFTSGQGNPGRPIFACGIGSFNHSTNTGTVSIGYGALADNSVILGGRDHNIESGNTGATIIGGEEINLTGTTYAYTTAVGELAIFETPITNGSNSNALVWNSTSKKLEINTSLGGVSISNAGLQRVLISNATGDVAEAQSNLLFNGTQFQLNDTNSVAFTTSMASFGHLGSGVYTDVEESTASNVLLTNLDADDDSGTIPTLKVVARKQDNTDVTTRPLLGLYNRLTSVATVQADGQVDLTNDLFITSNNAVANIGLRNSVTSQELNFEMSGNITKISGNLASGKLELENWEIVESDGIFYLRESIADPSTNPNSDNGGYLWVSDGSGSFNSGDLVFRKQVSNVVTDTVISNGGGSVSAANGLSVQGDNVVLGGTLTGHTVINNGTGYGLGFGNGICATGSSSMALGETTCAIGANSFAIGNNTRAIAVDTMAQGLDSSARCSGSHAEGRNGTAYAVFSHAEGRDTVTFNAYSHAEGRGSRTQADSSHAEGCDGRTFGEFSHAEGYSSRSCGIASHSEGCQTCTFGIASHSEGFSTEACGNASHAEGCNTIAIGNFSHAEGECSCTVGIGAHAEGCCTQAIGDGSHTEGLRGCATGNSSHSEGNDTKAFGNFSHSEGLFSVACGNASHAEGRCTNAVGFYSHAEGYRTFACGTGSHSEGKLTRAYAPYSHAQGYITHARGDYSFTSGVGNISRQILACGCGSFNHSKNDGGQSAGHGAVADYSVILGGCNNNIEVGNTGATLIGGQGVDLTGTDFSGTTVLGGEVAIFDEPIDNNSNNNVLVWNETTKKIEKNLLIDNNTFVDEIIGSTSSTENIDFEIDPNGSVYEISSSIFTDVSNYKWEMIRIVVRDSGTVNVRSLIDSNSGGTTGTISLGLSPIPNFYRVSFLGLNSTPKNIRVTAIRK